MGQKLMRNFDRTWTLELQTNIDSFRNAFRALVPEYRNREIRLGSLFSKFIVGRDYFGTMQEYTFKISRRDDYDSGGLTVYGKLIPVTGNLNIELRIVKLSAYKYFSIFFQAVIAAFIFGLFLNSFIRSFYDTYDLWPFWVLIAEWVLLTAGMFVVIVWLNHWYLDLRIADFNRAFRKLESAAKTE